MIIVVGNQKGGCGKTTIATNLAATLAGKGKDVVLFDADRQESVSNWVAERNEYQQDAPKVNTSMGYGNVSPALQDLNKRYEIVIVDVAGRDSNEFRTAARVADILLVPVKPSDVDVKVLPSFSQIVTQAQFVNDALKVFAFINIAPTHAQNQETGQVKEVIQSVTDWTLLNTVIYDRKVFRDSFSKGLGVTEFGGDVSAKNEIESLIAEMLSGY